ncbi:glutamate receptor 3-like isoform X2 [Liolophura sinensis]
MPEGSQDIQTTDMLNRLEQRKTDLIGPLEITFVNERVVDFTKPILTSGIVPVVKIPAAAAGDGRYNYSWLPLPSEIFIILKPFCAGVWLVTLLCFVAVSLFLYVINRFNPRERRYENEIFGGYDDDFGLAGSFLFAFSCLVWQGYPRAPRSISGRILTAFWWIFIVIFLMCYTAKLVFYLNQFPVGTARGNLATTGQASSDESLEDLMKEGYTFGVVKNSPTYYFFRQSRVPAYEKVWSLMKDAPNKSFVETPDDGYKKTMDGNFVFLTNSLSADYMTQREPCNLMTVGGLLTSQGIGLAVSTGSPLGNKLSEAILELKESGTIHKLYRKWWIDTGSCPGKAAAVGVAGISAAVRPLELSEFGGAYILLIIGAVLAAIALLLEILFARRQKKKATIVKKPEDTVIVETPAETAKV